MYCCTSSPQRGTTTEGGGFYLHNAPLTLGEGLCFAYYVVLEATWGATLGKLATNIRVVREDDGGPIAWRAAVIRNLLRRGRVWEVPNRRQAFRGVSRL